MWFFRFHFIKINTQLIKTLGTQKHTPSFSDFIIQHKLENESDMMLE